ncbi:MAG: oligopeptide/dipeptide ABC transporter ATP-binding protein [Bacilli bacterium]
MGKSKVLTNEPLIKIVGMKKYFPLKKTHLFQKEALTVKANDGVDLIIHKGETLGLVGESGCGKSTLGRVLLQLYPQTSGKIIYYGYTLEDYSPRYLFKEINRLKTSRLKYENLLKKIPLIEKKIEKKKSDPSFQNQVKANEQEIAKLQAECDQIASDCRNDFGTFFSSNNMKAIKQSLKLDEFVYKSGEKVAQLELRLEKLALDLEKAKKIKNLKAEAEVAAIKKQLENADLNLIADLNKKLSIAERKAQHHIISVDIDIRETQKNINIIKDDTQRSIARIKQALEKPIELNTEIITKLVSRKQEHFEKEKRLKQLQDFNLFSKEKGQIKNISKQIEKLINKTANVTGAFVLSDDIAEVSRTLFKNIDVLHRIQLNKDKLNLLEVRKFKVEQKIADDKETYTDFQKDVFQERLDKLNKKIAFLEAQNESLLEQTRQLSQAIKDANEKLSSHPMYQELESKKEKGLDLSRLTGEEMRRLRQDMQLIFQDPYSSLNPRLTVGQIIGEGLKAHDVELKTKDNYQDIILKVMDKCGLAPYMLHRYPHQFSGGQRQRIGIARALAVNPKFIVCDEAVSALDVSIQSQIINLLEDLRDQENLTYLFISHDLSVIKHISDRIGVMYLGKIVELGNADEVYKRPLHPYTKALISAIPTTDQGTKQRIFLEGDIPSNVFPPSGCKFRTRCPLARKECAQRVPEFREVEPGRFVACHFYEETETIKPS